MEPRRVAALLDDYEPSDISRNRISLSPFTRAQSTSNFSQSDPEDSLQRAVKRLADEPASLQLLSERYVRSLENFIPLGCLKVTAPNDQSGLDIKEGTWREIGDETGRQILKQCPFIPDLLEAGWIRVFYAPLVAGETTLRIYALPEDVGQSSIDRRVRSLRAALGELIRIIDVSPRAWKGQPTESIERYDLWATADDSSLFYIFNTLPSPSPKHLSWKTDPFTLLAMRELLGDDGHASKVPGLNTSLYPYQARSAAMMVQREINPMLSLDPRLEPRTAPDGSTFYYSPRDIAFFRNPRHYESIRGGILAETMGLGKTLICLAVILATRHTLPQVPVQYNIEKPVRPGVPSLLQSVISHAGKNSIPLKACLDRLRRTEAVEYSQITEAIDRHRIEYLVPHVPLRTNRRTEPQPPRRMRLCSGTIIVVPRNLVDQWRSELRKHVDSTWGLNVLVMDDSSKALPSPDDLVKYDIVLFSKPRFERENMDGSDRFGRTPTNVPAECRCPYIGATRTKDCICLKVDDLYQSPLKQLHWLRIIIDEGHEFSSSSSNAVMAAGRLVTADRRWVVSGTPARDRLFGVEVDLAALADVEELDFDDSASLTTTDGSVTSDANLVRRAALEKRRRYRKEEEVNGAAKSVGIMASNFLQVRPWAEFSTESKADWDDHIYQHESFRGKTYSAFSLCLRRSLEALVVKTQPEDVERDIVLPPLEHKVKYLEPSFYDKLTANLFILFLTANAVTSERTDVDYLFHKNSAKARYQLITNLRQSNFFWTGFSEDDIVSAIGHSTRYLEKENTNCAPEDRRLLQDALAFANLVLAVDGWKALSTTHELGIFVDHWPDSPCSWSLNLVDMPHMIGVTQLSQAQKLVNCQLLDDNPTASLYAAGIAAVLSAKSNREEDTKKKSAAPKNESKMGVPSSGLHSEPSKRQSISASSPSRTKKAVKFLRSTPKQGAPTTAASPTTIPPKSDSKPPESDPPKSNSTESTAVLNALPRISHKRKRSLDKYELPYYHPLALTSIIGTTSAKLTYLIQRIIELYESEKILVFYDGDNTAYYIAQGLELLHIKHLIYAKSLANDLRSKYIVAFDTDATIRVLLMDIRCGALGLNVNKASRVFFVNPVCRPSIEAQAIKRSHRIGQTKPVYVETLVLKGTIEEKIFERAKRMSRREHEKVAQLSDDQGIASIVQNARMLPVSLEDGKGEAQMAKLPNPLQLFGRRGRGDTKIKGIDLDFERLEVAGEKENGEHDVNKSKSTKRVKKSGAKPRAENKRKSKAADFRIEGYRAGPPIADVTVAAGGSSVREFSSSLVTVEIPAVPKPPTVGSSGSIFG